MSTTLSSFDSLSEPLHAALRELGWSAPTGVQARVIPAMDEGRDLIVQARTGSGKTGAFGIPIANHLDPEKHAPQALIMAPTRELAKQVAGELTILGKHRNLRCLPIYGGVGYREQMDGLQAGAHVIVGTPGRMLDHLSAGRLSLDAVRFAILDEADELLSLGFWPDMREIHRYLPAQRQTCLFSATMPEKVRALSRVFLKDPEFISLSEDQMAPPEIEHFYCLSAASEKEANLVRLIEYHDPESAIIFCNTKQDVHYLTSYLQRRGFSADAMAGDLSQQERERAMARIKASEIKFLVATDVAARGIDISDLSHVIGYTAPDSPEVYVHRTGRTGRAGKAGVAISLISGLDIGNFRQLQMVNRIEVLEMKLPTEEQILERIRERISVKVEREVRSLPESERSWKIDRLISVAQSMAQSEEGRRDLAAILSAYLQEHRPETSVTPERPQPRPAQEQSSGGQGGHRRRSGRGRRR